MDEKHKEAIQNFAIDRLQEVFDEFLTSNLCKTTRGKLSESDVDTLINGIFIGITAIAHSMSTRDLPGVHIDEESIQEGVSAFRAEYDRQVESFRNSR